MRYSSLRNILVSLLLVAAGLGGGSDSSTPSRLSARKAAAERSGSASSVNEGPKSVMAEHRALAPETAYRRSWAASSDMNHKALAGVDIEAPSTNARFSSKGAHMIELGATATRSKSDTRTRAAAEANNNPAATDLAPGTSANLSFPAVGSPTLFSGDYAYRIMVPQGATRLTVRLTTSTPNADVDLFLRYGSEPRLGSGGRVEADFTSDGPTGEETISISGASSPTLRAGTYYVSFAVYRTGVAVNGRVSASIEGAPPAPATPPTPPSGGNPSGPQLTSGEPVRVALPSISSPTLFVGDYVHRISVPAGAGRMVVKAVAQQSGVDVDLFVRRAAAPALNSAGAVVSDHSAEGLEGDETVVIDGSTNPSLQPGVYYIALAVFTPGRPVDVQLTATVSGTGNSGTAQPAPPPTAGGQILTPGQSVRVQLPAADEPTLFLGDFGYRFQVPAGATRIHIGFDAASAASRVQLFLRHGSDIDLNDSGVVSDHASPGASNSETLSVFSSSRPELRPGTYFLGFGVFSTGVPTAGTLTLTIDTAPAADPGLLRSGVPVTFSLPAVQNTTMFYGDYSYRIIVPEGARQLEVRLNTSAPDADVDLYLRHGRDNEVVDGRPNADHASESLTGNEVIVVNSSTRPTLRPGVYYVSFGLFTMGTPVTATVVALVQ